MGREVLTLCEAGYRGAECIGGVDSFAKGGETFLEVVGGEFGASSVGALPLVLGFVSAFVSGLFACRVMIALVKKAKLSWFALYCLVAAACIFIFA